MENLNKIIESLENFAPAQTAEEWDNSGWQIKLDSQNIDTIMLCVTVTESVLVQAIEKKADLIIAHHPCIFPHIKRIEDKKLIDAIKNNIQIYCAHTNFDKAAGGTSDCLAVEIGLKVTGKLNEYVTLAVPENEIPLDDLILKIKIALNTAKLKVVNYIPNKIIKKIALCAGSGASFIPEVNVENIDLYITSDIKYHDALEIKDAAMIDAGHFQSEKPSLNKLKSILTTERVNVLLADEKDIWSYI